MVDKRLNYTSAGQVLGGLDIAAGGAFLHSNPSLTLQFYNFANEAGGQRIFGPAFSMLDSRGFGIFQPDVVLDFSNAVSNYEIGLVGENATAAIVESQGYNITRQVTYLNGARIVDIVGSRAGEYGGLFGGEAVLAESKVGFVSARTSFVTQLDNSSAIYADSVLMRATGYAGLAGGSALFLGLGAYSQYSAYVEDGYKFGASSQEAALANGVSAAGLFSGAAAGYLLYGSGAVLLGSGVGAGLAGFGYLGYVGYRYLTDPTPDEQAFAAPDLFNFGSEASSGLPGTSFSFGPGSHSGGFDTDNFYSDASYFSESPSELAGIGLSATADIGGGGYSFDTTYDFTPGATTNAVFDDYYPSDSGYGDTSGNGYADYSFDDNSFDESNYYDYSDSYTYDFGFPVVLDLAGTGIEITPLTSSNTYYDLAGDGYKHRTAWAGAGNGVLVLDLAGTGQITERNQVVFTDWDPTAASDLQALANVFDTNHDGKLDAQDAQFASFKILVTNADGTTTLKTLAQAGVQSIDLHENAVATTLPDGSSIQGQSSFTRTDGTTGTAAAVSLGYDPNGYALRQTVTHNADGSTTIDNEALNPDGGLASETTTLTSANGLSRTISFDLWRRKTSEPRPPSGRDDEQRTFHARAA